MLKNVSIFLVIIFQVSDLTEIQKFSYYVVNVEKKKKLIQSRKTFFASSSSHGFFTTLLFVLYIELEAKQKSIVRLKAVIGQDKINLTNVSANFISTIVCTKPIFIKTI